MLLRGPRPYPPEIADPMMQPSPSTPPPKANGTSPIKTSRRSSYEVLKGIAPDSNLPLPRREPGTALEDFREGIPLTFGNGGTVSPPGYKRGGSPTRTLSRACFLYFKLGDAHPKHPGIPVSSVGQCFPSLFVISSLFCLDTWARSCVPPTPHLRW